MAILNGIEGSARVEVTEGGTEWNGYILIEPTPLNLMYFDIAGPAAIVFYEGPVLMDGKFYFANGKVRTRNINYTPEKARIVFVGIDTLNLIKPLPFQPNDYLSLD